MKYSIGIVTTITLIAAFVFSGCDRQSNEMDRTETSAIETNRDREIDQNQVETEFRTFRSENEDRLMEYDRTIEEIKQKIDNESDRDVKARLETKLDEYKEDHRELKREMDNYKVSGRDNWDEFKDSFSDRMDDLGDSLNDFFSSSSNISSN